MRCLIILFVYFSVLNVYPSPFFKQVLSSCDSDIRNPKYEEFNKNDRIYIHFEININLVLSHFLLLIFLVTSSFLLLICLWLQLCNQTRYAAFSTNLNLFSKKTLIPKSYPWTWFLSANITMLLLSELEIEQIYLFIFYLNPNFIFFAKLVLKYKKVASLILFYACSIVLFSLATTPFSHLMCIMVFQILCFSLKKISAVMVINPAYFIGK